ncbi:hypothetical protein ABLE94_25630 [Gordonia sp. VNK1]|uniref:hypothetical protein n=1 Tax=Gordonia oleivorans TaxID=3156618 RepID=UPI0032B60698
MLQKRITGRRMMLAAGLAAGALATPLAAGVASAAPETTAPETTQTTPAAKTLDATQQTPTVGLSRSGAMIAGGFVAPLAAAAVADDATVIWLEPMPKDACATTLSDAMVAVTWTNTSTHRTADITFAACRDGKPALSPALETGSGTLKLTVTVLGKGGDTFTLTPGTATLHR